MAASICTDTFTIAVAVNVDCLLTIPENKKFFSLAGFTPHQVTVPFTYFIGTDPDPNNPNFGFSLLPATPDPVTAPLQDNPGWPLGVVIENIRFMRDDDATEDTPDLSGDPFEIKGASVTFLFRIDQTVYYSQDTNRDSKFSFDLIIQLNTGVDPDAQ